MSKLQIENLMFRYEKKGKRVLDNVNFSIEKGAVIGLIGDNGTGKTTLMKLISGILKPNAGNISNKFNSIGVLIEEPPLYKDMSVMANLKFYCKLYEQDYQIIDEYKDVLGVGSFLNKSASKLSIGMKQRVGLFIALIASEEFILLDEPTNGLDPTGIRNLLTLIRKLADEKQITFMISSHILQNLEQICDGYIMMKDSNAIVLETSEIGDKKLNEVYFNEAL